MAFIRLLPAILSLLLLAAHFSRAGLSLLVVACLGLSLLLAWRRAWVARLTQLVLLAGGLEWLRTLAQLAAARQARGEPWTRLAVILGVVALFTVCSALVFQSAALRRRYGLDG